jgi:phage tail protein X
MFLENSRYYKVPTIETVARDGRAVTALKLRPLAASPGELHIVKDSDQLDVLAHQQYADGTKFWHIADANPGLQASDLVARTVAAILKPKS